jgi:hypothetical protein
MRRKSTTAGSWRMACGGWIFKACPPPSDAKVFFSFPGAASRSDGGGTETFRFSLSLSLSLVSILHVFPHRSQQQPRLGGCRGVWQRLGVGGILVVACVG